MKQGIVDILEAWLNSRLETIHTALPGRVEYYYGHTERKARVKPLITLRTQRNEEVKIPAIDNVPVIFPSTAKTDVLFPLEQGDGCLILFSEEAIGNFLEGSHEVSPEDERRFSLTDAICLPGLWSFRTAPVAPERANSFYLRYGSAEVELDAGNLIGLRNQVATLKAEIEKLWDEIKGLNDIGSSWTGVVAGTACTPSPGVISQHTTASARCSTNKIGVGQLLRD